MPIRLPVKLACECTKTPSLVFPETTLSTIDVPLEPGFIRIPFSAFGIAWSPSTFTPIRLLRIVVFVAVVTMIPLPPLLETTFRSPAAAPPITLSAPTPTMTPVFALARAVPVPSSPT